MGEFGFIQTVEEKMKLIRKRQIAGAVKARDLYNKLISFHGRLLRDSKCRRNPRM